MEITPANRSTHDERVANDVKEHGCHCISVFDPEALQPNFTYSMGIQDSADAPDIIIFGLSSKLSQALVNEYCDRVRAGERFAPGVLISGFLEGFEVLIEPALPDRYAEYVLGCLRYYGDRPFEVVQLIWPSTAGIWPWAPEASDWLKQNQPLLCRARPAIE